MILQEMTFDDMIDTLQEIAIDLDMAVTHLERRDARAAHRGMLVASLGIAAVVGSLPAGQREFLSRLFANLRHASDVKESAPKIAALYAEASALDLRAVVDAMRKLAADHAAQERDDPAAEKGVDRMSMTPDFNIGDRVIKNPDTWIPTAFDGWGAGEGIGIIVEPQFDLSPDCVDVRWPTGRACQQKSELLHASEKEG